MTQYQPSVSTLKEVLMKKWNLIQNQPLLRQIFKEPPIISYKKGKSLKDMLVSAKIEKVNTRFHPSMDVWPVTPCIFSSLSGIFPYKTLSSTSHWAGILIKVTGNWLCHYAWPWASFTDWFEFMWLYTSFENDVLLARCGAVVEWKLDFNSLMHGSIWAVTMPPCPPPGKITTLWN